MAWFSNPCSCVYCKTPFFLHFDVLFLEDFVVVEDSNVSLCILNAFCFPKGFVGISEQTFLFILLTKKRLLLYCKPAAIHRSE